MQSSNGRKEEDVAASVQIGFSCAYTREQLLSLRFSHTDSNQKASGNASNLLPSAVSYSSEELDCMLLKLIALGQLPPPWLKNCTCSAKRQALLAALRQSHMHIVFALQPQSDHFREELQCIELDKSFLFDAMTALWDDATNAGMDHPPLAPVSWLLENGATAESILCRQRGQSRLGGLKMLGKLGAQAHVAGKQLISSATDDDARIRRASIDAIANIGACAEISEVAPVLAQCLEDRDPHVRDAAANALGRIGESGILAAAAALHSENQDVQGLAARALGIAGASSLPHSHILASWLDKEAVPLRIEAAQALGRMGQKLDPFIISSLAAQAESGIDDNLREAAIAALGNLGEVATPYCDVIASSLDYPSPFVQEAAATALERILDTQNPKCTSS